jgi:hypothetical protein
VALKVFLVTFLPSGSPRTGEVILCKQLFHFLWIFPIQDDIRKLSVDLKFPLRRYYGSWRRVVVGFPTITQNTTTICKQRIPYRVAW